MEKEKGGRCWIKEGRKNTPCFFFYPKHICYRNHSVKFSGLHSPTQTCGDAQSLLTPASCLASHIALLCHSTSKRANSAANSTPLLSVLLKTYSASLTHKYDHPSAPLPPTWSIPVIFSKQINLNCRFRHFKTRKWLFRLYISSTYV